MRRLTVLAAVFVLTVAMATVAAADEPCEDTGIGLDANHVNQVPDEPFTVTCDIGIFFDTGATVDGARVNGAVDDARSVQYGIYVHDADVTIRRSTVEVDEDFGHQFVSIAYQGGATGDIVGNTLSGAHRVAILLRGDATDVRVRGNVVAGTGAKSSGWAGNGVQVDQGAAASINGNTIEGHWWDGESNWASTGILLFADDSSVTNNELVDNEFSVYVVGDDNRVSGNRVSSNVVSGSSLGFRAYGVLVAGSHNHVAGNRLDDGSHDGGAAGIYVFGGSERNRITGNRISGFEWPSIDGGDETLERGNPSPAS